MRAALAALALCLVASAHAFAGDSLWTLAIVGRRDVVLPMRHGNEAMPSADAHLLGPELNFSVSARGDAVSIRDANGAEWQTANGSTRLDGAIESRVLSNAVEVMQESVFLPLDAIAQLAARKLVLEDRSRAFLLPQPPLAPARVASKVATAASAAPAAASTRTPLGWQSFDIPKTAEERSAMTRENDDNLALQEHPALPEVLPSSHDALGIDLGFGFAQRGGAAIDAVGGGLFAGYRVGLAGFVTANTSAATFRSGRIAVESPSTAWTTEAGDLLSEMRGLARGVRVSRRLTSRWRPGVSVYVNDRRVPGDRPSAAYRDDLLLTRNVDVRGEIATDGSHFFAARLIAAGGSIEAIHRYASDRDVADRGLSGSYSVGRGISAYGGVRQSSGSSNERWTMFGVALPLVRGASVSLEQARTERSASSDVANTFGLQLPFGPVRVMQRYTWTDVALIEGPSLFESGRRQLQSMASFSPISRLRFNYQLGTQWFPGSDARQWTELESVVRVSRSTSLHAVTGLPDVRDQQRFRVGVQQQLPRAFRLTVDYGHLPAFESSSPTAPEAARLLVMVRRNWTVATPAAGGDVEGTVRDDSGATVAGAAVSLGRYMTTTGADGRYRFPHVPPGEHQVALVRDHLPAAFALSEEPRSVAVHHASIRADLAVVSLRAIHGRVYIDRNGNGRLDEGEAIAGTVVRLDEGTTATLTSESGRFDFYNLQPGQYDVWLDATRLRSDLELASPARLTVTLQPDRPATDVEFMLAVHDKPILMTELP